MDTATLITILVVALVVVVLLFLVRAAGIGRRRPLVLSVLRERGHPLTERDLPQELQRAHKLGYTSRDKTEGMRQAMLHYRAVMEQMVGPEEQVRREMEQRRREMA